MPKVGITDTILRDGHQSQAATRMKFSQMEPMLEKLCELAPHITRCAGAGKDAYAIVDRAIRFGCKKLQLFNDKFDQAMIDRAHEHGIICNVCQANKQEKAQRYLDMGIDTILTNEYLLIKQVVDKAEKYTKY